MNLSINLNDGSTLSAIIPDFTASTFGSSLNEPKLTAIAIGDIVLNKNNIFSITPTETDPNANVAIYLSSGRDIKETVENYKATDYSSQINDPRLSFVVIGNSITNKNMIKMIAPIEQPTV